MRILVDKEPFYNPDAAWLQGGYWPADWIGHPQVQGTAPAVTAYRRRFSLDRPLTLRLHVTADERYELYIDGERVGRGSERGDRLNWFYESYDFELSAGEHTIVAHTWWLGSDTPAPYAQLSVRPAFLLAAEGQADDLLNTGKAPWECKVLGGYSWVDPECTFGTGAKVHIRGSEFDWGFERGEGEGWIPAQTLKRAVNASEANEYPSFWLLRPATLPSMLSDTLQIGEARHVQRVESEETRQLHVDSAESIAPEAEAWNAMLQGRGKVTVPANTMRRAIIDLGDYYCAYPELTVTGGAGSKVRLLWAEALFEKPESFVKGNRNEIEGKQFVGIGDTFEPDGGAGRTFSTLWWEAGRYVEALVITADEPLVIDSLKVRETHYPYDYESRFEADDPRLAGLVPLAQRVMEMCSHETYMDCPYYEQLQYIGDTRLEALTTYALTHDDRLPRKAVYMFDKSRWDAGITQSRYPSRVLQIIPPFSLWWVGMVHDYAMWRDDPQFVLDRMSGVRAVIDKFKSWMNQDSLVEHPIGWNFMDWAPNWHIGDPPDGTRGVSGVINWQTAMILGLAAELEEMLDEPELAARNRRLRDRIVKAATAAFWDEERGIFADDLAHQCFSEHTQCLALLSGTVDEPKRERIAAGLLNDPELTRTTIYFMHYLFEAYRLIGRMDRFFDRMGLWFSLEGQGFKTTLESPEPSRSDCHAWGAHPLFHYYTSILGIRPSAPGFARVSIEPQLAHMGWAKGRLAHPKGFVEVDVRRDGDLLAGSVTLPDGVTGVLSHDGRSIDLRSGHQEFRL